MTSCPAGFTGCSVHVTPNAGTPGTGWTTIPFQTIAGHFVAPFSGTITVLAAQLPASVSLTATGDSGLAPDSAPSDPFDVALYVQQCNPNCSFPQKPLPITNLTGSYADLTGDSGFTFMTLSPYTLSFAPRACTEIQTDHSIGSPASPRRTGVHPVAR